MPKSNFMSFTKAFEKFVDSPYYFESELCGRCGAVSFSKYPPMASDPLFTTLHPLLETVLHTVCRKIQEDYGTGGFDILITSKFLLNLFHHLTTAAYLTVSSP
jgi:hypothetical protein